MVKEHHLTKAKRLREEALAPVIEAIESLPKEMKLDMPEKLIHVGEPKGEPVKKINWPYWCYDARANLRYRALSEDEAKVFLRAYPGGFWNMWPDAK